MKTIDIRQSTLKSWLRCRRKTYLRYGLGWVEQQHPGDVRGIGSFVHGMLAEYYGGEEFHSSDLDFNFGPDDVTMANAMVASYINDVENNGLDAFQTTELVEQRMYSVRIEVEPGLFYRVSCQVDQVYYDLSFDCSVGRDHKTVKAFTTTADNDFQLLTYNVILDQNGRTCDYMEHNLIKRNKRTAAAKPPFIQRNRIQVTEKHRASHWAQLENMVREYHLWMTAPEGLQSPGIFATADNTCAWSCDYSDICGTISQGEDYLSALEAEFTQEEAPQ